jgi:hypothetical protein
MIGKDVLRMDRYGAFFLYHGFFAFTINASDVRCLMSDVGCLMLNLRFGGLTYYRLFWDSHEYSISTMDYQLWTMDYDYRPINQ